MQFPSCLLDGKICLILCALISTEVSLYSCFQLSIHRNKFKNILSLSSCMEYITTCALPVFVLLLCQTKSFSSDPFLIIIPHKSRVNILLYLQRVFHSDDAKDVHVHTSLGALSSGLFWEEVSRQLTHLHAQLVVLTEPRSVCSHFGVYTNRTPTGNLASDAVFISLVMGKK